MLSKHDRKSRTRITAGVTGAAALTLAGLALTASGTQAAANLRADVGDAIGVDLQEAPAAPTVPDAPDAPAAVEAPAPADAPTAPDEARTVRKIRIVTRDKDGKVTVSEDGDVRALGKHKRVVIKDGKVVDIDGMLADMPMVSSAKCGAPKDGDIKMESKDGKRRKIVICTDRIDVRTEAAAARAEAARAIADDRRLTALARANAARDIALESRTIAIASADMGKRHAMLGLKMARRSIEAQDDLSATQKAAALKGIDEAIREIEAAQKD